MFDTLTQGAKVRILSAYHFYEMTNEDPGGPGVATIEEPTAPEVPQRTLKIWYVQRVEETKFVPPACTRVNLKLLIEGLGHAPQPPKAE
jgi:hypothetical protein